MQTNNNYGLTGENLDVLKKYVMATCWLMLYTGRPEITQEYTDQIWEKLTGHEDTLRTAGITDEQFDDIRSRCDKLTSTPIDELRPDQGIFILRLIFGPTVDWKK